MACPKRPKSQCRCVVCELGLGGWYGTAGAVKLVGCSDHKSRWKVQFLYCRGASISLSAVVLCPMQVEAQCVGQAGCAIGGDLSADPCVGTYKYAKVSYKCAPPGAVRGVFPLL